MRTWVDDQQRNRTQMQVEADSVGDYLAFGWSHFNRGHESPWNATRRQAEGEAAQPDVDGYAGRGRPGCRGLFGGRHGPTRASRRMADADFERLASDPRAQPEVAAVFGDHPWTCHRRAPHRVIG